MTGSLRGTRSLGWAGVETSLLHAGLYRADLWCNFQEGPLIWKAPPHLKGSHSSSGRPLGYTCRVGVHAVKLGYSMQS